VGDLQPLSLSSSTERKSQRGVTQEMLTNGIKSCGLSILPVLSVKTRHGKRGLCTWALRRQPLLLQTKSQKRDFVDPSPFIQSAMVNLQASSGLPWWATFASATLLVRSAMLPILRNQILATKKLAEAMPELNFLLQLLKQRLNGIPHSQVDERVRIVAIFIKGVKACLVLHDISVLKMLFYPLFNISVFVTFIYSLRDMIKSGIDGDVVSLQEGGLLWFSDLTSKDTTFLLPLSALGLSYTSLHVAFSGQGGLANQGRVVLFMCDILQSLVLISMPFVLTLPCGVFAYWIPSSLFGIFQTLALRQPFVQKLLRLPMTQKAQSRR